MRRTVGLLVRQVRYEQKAFWRNPATVFFTLAFPIVLLVIFGSINSGARPRLLDGLEFNQYYVPSIAAFGIMSACFANLAGRLVARREAGTLKRLRATPAGAAVVIGGLTASAVVIGAAVAVVTTTIGVVFYDVDLPSRWPAFGLILVTGAASFCALGIAFSTAVPNAEATEPMIYGIFMPLVFISGAFFPIRSDTLLAQVASIFPVRHLIEATFTAFDPRVSEPGIPWTDLAIIGAWAIGGLVVAGRRFRWERARR